MNHETIMQVENLKVHFDVSSEGDMPWTKRKKLQAVNGVSFELKSGETLGIVGESGCGKSTLARAIISMVPAETGRVLWFGKDLLALHKTEMRKHRKEIQMIFQDPLASLNPRMTIGEIIAEPLKTHYPKTSKADIKARVGDVMNKVGLLENLINRYPHEFSGGQRQRISIARALATQPRLLVCDEPTSALDVSIQAQILNLLKDLQEQLNLTILFISHDLPVVRQMCDRIAVLKNGKLCEISMTEELFKNPSHGYTKELLKLMPKIESIYN